MTAELKRIMLVEDDSDIATLATMALQDLNGFEVVHFPTGNAAIEAVEEVRPDLVLLDFSMPGLNGGEVLQHLRANRATSHIPAIFMTASVMPSHVSKLIELGALEVIKKPFDPMTLGDQIRKAWERR